MKLFFKHAKDKRIATRSIKISLIVGTFLALINHYDALLSGQITKTTIFQIVLTYLVPYIVATYGAASQAKCLELEKLQKKEKI